MQGQLHLKEIGVDILTTPTNFNYLLTTLYNNFYLIFYC